MTSPVLAWIISVRPFALRESQKEAVRRSCHTMALQIGLPEAASQTMVVSRWLVMPMATISQPRTCATASLTAARTEDRMSRGFCSTHAWRGKSWVNSLEHIATWCP